MRAGRHIEQQNSDKRAVAGIVQTAPGGPCKWLTANLAEPIMAVEAPEKNSCCGVVTDARANQIGCVGAVCISVRAERFTPATRSKALRKSPDVKGSPAQGRMRPTACDQDMRSTKMSNQRGVGARRGAVRPMAKKASKPIACNHECKTGKCSPPTATFEEMRHIGIPHTPTVSSRRQSAMRKVMAHPQSRFAKAIGRLAGEKRRRESWAPMRGTGSGARQRSTSRGLPRQQRL